MNAASRPELRLPAWAATAGIAVLAIASSVTNLFNTFVQDDLPIVKGNALVHTLRIWPLFTQAYWPAPYPRELYRPLTSSLLALEWVVGGGSPMAFRIGSVLLYVVASLAVYRLARRLIAPGAAWLAAALFAVHPVHVEAVAVGVNQAELVVGTLLVLLMTAYIDRRRSGAPLTTGWMLRMAGGYLVAALFKEHALLLPALMVGAEFTLIDDPRPWRERFGAQGLRPFFLVMALVAVAFVAVRTLALGGDTKGSFTAEALVGLSFGWRALTMLGVVPQWFRLFFWPEHLRADYSPNEIVATTRWGLDQTLGALLIVAWVVGIFWFRRRRPVISFALIWMAVAMALVSNVFLPTGIVLAERTLFLATVGVVLIAGDLLWSVGRAVYAQGTVGRLAAIGTATVLLTLGAIKSGTRQLVWHDLASLWYQTMLDAPQSYRAQQAYGSVLFQVGMEKEAEQFYRNAIQIYPKAWPLLLEYADKLRERGHCEAAIRYYIQVLLLTPQQSGPRASEIACLVWAGKYAQASTEARIGGGYGVQTGTFGLYKHIADSALAISAPPHTVVLPPPIDSIPAPAKP